MISRGIGHIKNIISNGIDLLYPQFCFNCRKEGNYLCEDCRSILEISGIHQDYNHNRYQRSSLKDLYFPLSYQSLLIKNLIQKFKYQPFVKELAKTLASLIINHFQLIDKFPYQNLVGGSSLILIPVPLEKKRLKWRGFNQAEELAKELSIFLKIPLIPNCLIKTKESLPQIDLSEEERKKNVKGVFLCKNPNQIKEKKVFLIDDIYTTGATMEECAKVLKEAGAEEIIGIVIARD